MARDLCAPDKPGAKTYDQLIKLIRDHLNPKSSETMERYKFNQVQQTATESVADFVQRLKHFSLNCYFMDANVTIRDRFICGLRNHATKKKLLSETNLKYGNAYKIALAMEAAKQNSTITVKINTEVPANINAVN